MPIVMHHDARPAISGFMRTTVVIDNDVAGEIERLRHEGMGLSEDLNLAGAKRDDRAASSRTVESKHRTSRIGLKVDVPICSMMIVDANLLLYAVEENRAHNAESLPTQESPRIRCPGRTPEIRGPGRPRGSPGCVDPTAAGTNSAGHRETVRTSRRYGQSRARCATGRSRDQHGAGLASAETDFMRTPGRRCGRLLQREVLAVFGGWAGAEDSPPVRGDRQVVDGGFAAVHESVAFNSQSSLP